MIVVREPLRRLPSMVKGGVTLGVVSDPFSPQRLLAYGPKSVSFWIFPKEMAKHQEDNVTVEARSGDFSNVPHEPSEISAACFLDKARFGPFDAVVASQDGFLFAFVEGSAMRVIEVVLGEPVTFVLTTPKGLVCGGHDAGLTLLTPKFEPAQPRVPVVSPIDGSPLALTTAAYFGQKEGERDEELLLLGTATHEIAMVEDFTWKPGGISAKAKVRMLQKDPLAGVTAVCGHPVQTTRVAIGTRAGQVLFCDTQACQMLPIRPFSCRSPVTALHWGPKGRILAAGLLNGSVELISTVGWLTGKGWAHEEPRFLTRSRCCQAEITEVRFQPEKGDYLCVGSADQTVVVFNLERHGMGTDDPEQFGVVMQRHAVLRGLTSGVLGCQFSNCGSYLMASSRDASLLCWNLGTRRQETMFWQLDEQGVSWFGEGHNYHLSMGWPVMGLWSDTSYISTADLVAKSDYRAQVLACGDVMGRIKLLRFPSPPLPERVAEYHEYRGHCSRVANIAWTRDGRLLSVGCSDSDCLLQWRLSTYQPLEAPQLGLRAETDKTQEAGRAVALKR